MSRQEDFINAGIKYRFENGKPMSIGGDNFAEMTREMNRTKPFEAGAEYGYQYAFDKACEWISVEDELPPKRKNSLVLSNEVFIHTTGGDYLSAVYDYQDKRWIDVYNIETLGSNKVTHWMPIVPPRKEE